MNSPIAPWFFQFYRQRLKNLETLGSLVADKVSDTFPGSFEPERFVNAMTALDSLAARWAKLHAPGAELPQRERLGNFLAEHGEPTIWTKCSVPDLLSRARGSAARVHSLSSLRNAHNEPGTMRPWQDDLPLDEIVSHPSIQKAGIKRDWLRESRYGEILYKELRCNWLHEYDGPLPGRYSPMFGEPADLPRYENWHDEQNPERERVLVFPLPLLIRTLRHVLDSFEAQCNRQGNSPFGAITPNGGGAQRARRGRKTRRTLR